MFLQETIFKGCPEDDTFNVYFSEVLEKIVVQSLLDYFIYWIQGKFLIQPFFLITFGHPEFSNCRHIEIYRKIKKIHKY